MRTRFLPLLAASAAALGSGPPSNVISSVEVKDTGAEVVVTIHAGEHPVFTSFPMTDPPGFVIDVSESHFRGVPEELPGAGGIVGRITAWNYGSKDGPNRIARVRLDFAVELDPPAVEVAGDAIVVRIAKPPAERPAAELPADPAPAGPVAGEASKQ